MWVHGPQTGVRSIHTWNLSLIDLTLAIVLYKQVLGKQFYLYPWLMYYFHKPQKTSFLKKDNNSLSYHSYHAQA